VFESEEDKSTRKRLREFSGFSITKESDEYMRKIAYINESLNNRDLLSFGEESADKENPQRSNLFNSLVSNSAQMQNVIERKDYQTEGKKQKPKSVSLIKNQNGPVKSYKKERVCYNCGEKGHVFNVFNNKKKCPKCCHCKAG